MHFSCEDEWEDGTSLGAVDVAAALRADDAQVARRRILHDQLNLPRDA